MGVFMENNFKNYSYITWISFSLLVLGWLLGLGPLFELFIIPEYLDQSLVPLSWYLSFIIALWVISKTKNKPTSLDIRIAKISMWISGISLFLYLVFPIYAFLLYRTYEPATGN